jgi:hypothetical protein
VNTSKENNKNKIKMVGQSKKSGTCEVINPTEHDDTVEFKTEL